jgi:hypothetical protein
VNSNLKGNQSHGRLQISTNAMAPWRSNKNLNNPKLIVKWWHNSQDVQTKKAHPDPTVQLYLAMGRLLKECHSQSTPMMMPAPQEPTWAITRSLKWTRWYMECTK